MKPLTKEQERGMLLQAPLGMLTSFLYDNLNTFGAVQYLFNNPKATNEDMAPFVKKDKELHARIETIMASMRNNSVGGCVVRMLQLMKDGIKGIAPSAVLADSMALTEASYLCDDFRLPYKTIVIEIPQGCRGHIRIASDQMPEELDKHYGDLWNISLKDMTETGAEARYIILTELESENIHYDEFDGDAERHIAVEIITTEFLKGDLVRKSPFLRTVLGHPHVFNPAPVSSFTRPLIKGKTMEEVVSYKSGERDTSPGTINIVGDDAPLMAHQHYADGSELEYMLRITRMAVNVVFALTSMGYEEEKKVSTPKLQNRGSESAKRVIPDVLRTTTVMDVELKKVKYDDSSGYSGIVMSPHFRRGHWRKQRHGAGRSEVKNVWIAPLVVNKHLLRESRGNVIK